MSTKSLIVFIDRYGHREVIQKTYDGNPEQMVPLLNHFVKGQIADNDTIDFLGFLRWYSKKHDWDRYDFSTVENFNALRPFENSDAAWLYEVTEIGKFSIEQYAVRTVKRLDYTQNVQFWSGIVLDAKTGKLYDIEGTIRD